MIDLSVRTPQLRFPWRWYASAWAPYSLLYLVIFIGQQDGVASVGSALWRTGVNMLPAALLGVIVANATYRLARRSVPLSLSPMIIGHLAASLIYSGLLYLAICTEYGLPRFITRGTWTWSWFYGPGLLWQLLTGVMLYFTLAGLAHSLGVTHRLRESELRVHAAEALRARAELHALRAQLHPHFLFNTLHSVMALIRRDPPRAESAVEQLAALLRYTLRMHDSHADEGADSTVGEELTFVRDYLALEALRFRDRLEVRIDVPEALLRSRLPSFTLQGLVENAVKHGINTRRAGGRITITGAVDGDFALLRVRDDGVQADDAAVVHVSSVDGGTGLGLHLVRERLRISFGGSATLTLGRQSPTSFEVRVRIPLAERALVSQPAA